MEHELISHPDAPPHGVPAVAVRASLCAGPSELRYRVRGAALFPPPASPLRTDGLWRHSCFELFVMPEQGTGYFEFNFAPSTQWAAYRFSAYRDGMAELPVAPPAIVPHPDGVDVRVDLGSLPAGMWRVALTAVIEEPDGTKSYWALRHPGDRPDFHAPGGFVLSVAA